jgi:hypothetical protein
VARLRWDNPDFFEEAPYISLEATGEIQKIMSSRSRDAFAPGRWSWPWAGFSRWLRRATPPGETRGWKEGLPDGPHPDLLSGTGKAGMRDGPLFSPVPFRVLMFGLQLRER